MTKLKPLHFRFEYNTKSLANCVYDLRDVRLTLIKNRLILVIAINGREHYRSSMPKEKDYRKRIEIERFFFLLKVKLNFLNIRVKGIKETYGTRVWMHVGLTNQIHSLNFY